MRRQRRPRQGGTASASQGAAGAEDEAVHFPSLRTHHGKKSMECPTQIEFRCYKKEGSLAGISIRLRTWTRKSIKSRSTWTRKASCRLQVRWRKKCRVRRR
ncbi:hypothetical protein ACQJBY_068507 [Aegilops geniculata]